MKFSLEWLKQHLETNASAEKIADKLTAIGLEVESISNPAEELAPFAVTDDGITDSQLFEHRGGNFARERAFLLPVHILSAKLND